jgi:uncharacterized protein
MNNLSVFDFVKTYTSQFDESHDANHALSVYYNAIKIANEDYPEYDHEIILYASLLHDVCDHKYTNTIKKEELYDYIKSKLTYEKAEIVMDIINNISYSREISGQRKNVHQPYLDIISDADRLEAIGEIGIKRCIIYRKTKNGKIPEDIIEHCHEKLLRLYNDGFIRTKTGRIMAEPLHKFIENYVSNQ